MIKLEVVKNNYGNWSLWKTVENFKEDRGNIFVTSIFNGTRKECLEEKEKMKKAKSKTSKKGKTAV